MSNPWKLLNDALARAGIPRWTVERVKGFDFELRGPVNIIVNTGMDATPYSRILLKYAPRLTYREIISIRRDNRYTTARRMLMGVLARAKSDEAFDVLVGCLGDPTVRAHAIEALGRFGRREAISILERLAVQKGLYEYKAKETALRRLRRVGNSGTRGQTMQPGPVGTNGGASTRTIP